MELGYFEYNQSNKKGFLVAAIAVLGVIGVVGIGLANPSKPTSLRIQQLAIEEQEFRDYMDKFNKNYETEAEFAQRFQIFRENSALIRAHNAKYSEPILEVNKFADLTNEEFMQKHIGQQRPVAEPSALKNSYGANYPDRVDWRDKGAVTDVKNQEDCYSGWAFSAVGAVEGAWFIKTGKLIPMSEQELVDCSEEFGNSGCLSGTIDAAYEFMEKYGITSQANYPYKGIEMKCNVTLEKNIVANVTGFTAVESFSEEALQAAVVQRPVSVGVDSRGYIWQFYKTGVVTKFCGEEPNHDVLVVGYDKTNNDDPKKNFWIVKNSWGSDWGNEGYIYIGIEEGPGVCGIQVEPSYPIVN